MANQGFDITDEDLNKILAEVESNFVPVLKSANEQLRKAKDESAPPKPEESSSAPAEGSSPPVNDGDADDAPPASPPPAASAAPSAPPSPASPSPSAPPSPEASGEGAMPADPAAMTQMVASLSPEQAKALYLAIKERLFAEQGSAAASPAPAAMAPPEPQPSPGSEAAPAFKGEMPSVPANGNVHAKSEVDELKKLVKAQADMLSTVQGMFKEQGDKVILLEKAVTVIAGTPMRKAITGISHIAKAEGSKNEVVLSKSEVTSKIKSLDRSKLSKKDRDAITTYYDRGSNDYSPIKHLLEQ